MPLFGAHLSIAGGFHQAALDAHAHGCQTLQVFTKAPSQWAGREITTAEARLFRRTLRETKLRFPVAHDSYLINLASPNEALYRRSIEAFVDELMRAEMLSYSRARGLFAGISLNGATMRPDADANKELYGAGVTNEQILMGQAKSPASAAKMEGLLNKNSSRQTK